MGIALRAADGDAMREVESADVLVGRGLAGENRRAGKREVTLLSAEAWQHVCDELDTSLPWTARRANLLVAGIDLQRAIGRTLAVGEVRIRIHGETKPCPIMDQQHAGLRASLVPDCRGGVHGQVLAGGTLRSGDSILLVP